VSLRNLCSTAHQSVLLTLAFRIPALLFDCYLTN